MNRRSLCVAATLLAATSLIVIAQNGPRPRPMPGHGHGANARSKPTDRTGGPRHGSRWSRRLTDEQIEKLLVRLEKEQPEMHKRLIRLRKENPGAFRGAMTGIDRMARFLDLLPLELQEVFKRQQSEKIELAQILKRYHAEKDEARKKQFSKEVGELTARQFDDDQKMREYRLGQLTKQLAELKTQLAERTANRDSIIAERTKALLHRPYYGRHPRPAAQTQPAKDCPAKKQ